MTRRVFHLLPNAPGALCGIADYALCLADAWRQAGACESTFLHLNPKLAGREVAAEIVEVSGRSPLQFCAELPNFGDGAALLLHYEAYGFAANGDPRWFGPALAALRQRKPRLAIVVFFHELFAVAPPWRRAFYLTRKQQSTVKQIASLVKRIATSNQGYAAWLQRHGFSVTTVLPVLSNVGAPPQAQPWPKRSNAAVVFGGGAMRSRLYREGKKHWPNLMAELAIENLIDIGPPLKALPAQVTKRMGVLPAAEVSRALGDARFGLIAAREDELAKSGIFAAYAAHGVVPVVLSRGGAAADGLRSGQSYLAIRRGRLQPALTANEAVAAAARRWYDGHDAGVHAAALSRLLFATA